MNCRYFETIIAELASDKLMDAEARKRGLAHAGTCARCAARLADERAVSLALRLAASEETGETPARVKTALLAAFAQTSASHASADTIAPAFEQPGIRRRPRRAFAVAAALLAMLAIPAISILWPAQPSRPVQTKNEGPTVPTPQMPSPADLTLGGGRDAEPVKLFTPPIARPAPRKARNRAATIADGKKTAPSEESNIPTEMVTEYFPLTYVAESTAMKSGRVVRIEVPRSTLLSMGLPMNVNRMNEMVKADVVISDDGLARAIRFVYDTKAQGSDSNRND